ncbi:hypothetical protein DFH28DRAFT_1047391 [Melampsora americana]|nr:hypothetical protein DFH28DRAFT_1047391 [Melampsora americana]
MTSQSQSVQSQSAPLTKVSTRRSKRATNASDSNAAGPAPAQKSKQISWVKDLNEHGQSSLEGIVQWMGLTWGDQDSPEDSTWMCMEPSDLISTNYSAYQSGHSSKKECCERLATYLVAKGFTSRGWKGCKQQIEVFEAKFRGAEAWRRQTGAGILEQAETEIADLQADPDAAFDEEKGESIRLTAATSTNDMLKRLCKFYDELVPIMGDRAANEPLAVAEVFSNSQLQQSTTNVISEQTSPNDPPPVVNPLDSPDSFVFEEALEVTPTSSRCQSPEAHHQTPILEEVLPPIVKPRSTNSGLKQMPPASCQPNSTQTPQRSASNKKNEITKAVRSSLPKISDLKELAEEHKKDRSQIEGLKDQMATSTQDFITFLGSRLDGPTSSKAIKRQLEEDPETAAKRQALDNELTTKQTELNLLKINRELQVEQAALEALQRGSSGVDKLTLACEKIQWATQMISVGLSKEEAFKIAEDIANGL